MVGDALVGRVLDGRYLIQSRLARGGMATVYVALDQRLDRQVALKIMHAGLAEDDAFVSRFQREAKSAARLAHPHVVSVYDQGESDGVVYLAMEYVPGRTVRDVLRSHGRLTPEQALTILDPVLQALVAAHRAGFVHRDIKPENVLLGDDGTVKVADFGLARAISTSTSTATQGILIGTVAYLSPEQVERGVADARSDVYGAGILLYEMLTGSVPYAGETPLAVAYQHVNAAVPRPSSVRPGMAKVADDLVARATRQDPDERWRDAAEFLDAVRVARRDLPSPRPLTVDLTDGASTLVVAMDDEHLVDSPVPLAASGRKSKPKKPPKVKRRRSRGWVVLVAVLVVAALVGGVGWWFGSARTVPVPPVVGQTLDSAQAAFADTGLTLQAGDPQYSETVKKDLIITTDPVPGGEARVGSTVTATLSLGPERHAVPGVAGKSVADAKALIAGQQLSVASSTQRRWDEKVPTGMVIGTSPKLGQQLRKDTPVTLIVSKGPQPIKIRDLAGMTKENALAWLTKKGLTGSVSGEEYSMSQPAGRVLSSSPAEGATLYKGDAVSLVVSKGPPPVDVPSVRGMGESAAVAKLESLGLKVKVNKPALGYTPFGLVQGQSAVGQGALHKGDTITITVV
jgi:serine/threonine-protein kinase